MDMQAITSQLAVLFILLVLGYAGGKLKVLTPDTGKVMTRLVMNITLPCMALSSVVGGDLRITGGETAFYMLMSLLVFLIVIIIALVSARFLVKDKQSRGLYSYMIIFSNSAFMGYPVSFAIYGEASVFYIALFNITFLILVFTLGTILMSNKGGKADIKAILCPALITAVLVIPLALFGFKAPQIIADAIRLTGSMTTPASMLIIGVSLSLVPIKDVFSEWRLYPMALIKLLVVPALTWLVLKPIIADDLVLGMLVVISAMPTAAIAAMHAIEHGNNVRTASAGIFLTTLASCASIPLIVYLLLM